MIGDKNYPPELIERARELMKAGEFTREVLERVPANLYFDDVKYTCGHAGTEPGGANSRIKASCHQCVEEWLRTEHEKV